MKEKTSIVLLISILFLNGQLLAADEKYEFMEDKGFASLVYKKFTRTPWRFIDRYKSSNAVKLNLNEEQKKQWDDIIFEAEKNSKK